MPSPESDRLSVPAVSWPLKLPRAGGAKLMPTDLEVAGSSVNAPSPEMTVKAEPTRAMEPAAGLPPPAWPTGRP